MDGKRFDQFSKAIAGRSTRRSFLKKLGGAALLRQLTPSPTEPKLRSNSFDPPGDNVRALSDSFRDAWHRSGGNHGWLGAPFSGSVPVADGEAVYFERGCLWRGPASDGQIIASTILPPLLGRPHIGTTGGAHFPQLIQWIARPELIADAEMGARIIQRQPSLAVALWQDQLALRPVLPPEEPAELIPIDVGDPASLPHELAGEPLTVQDAASRFGVTLQDRTLYDIVRMSGELISPSALYVRDSWDEFTFIHATDLHVNRRSDAFKGLLRLSPDLQESAGEVVNYNDGPRDLIRYANALHDRGLLDFIVMTGDLVDYVYERPNNGLQPYDDRSGGGNFAFFKELILGEKPSPEGEPVDGPQYGKLRVPIYTTLGNHDYRIGPYLLKFKILGIPEWAIEETICSLFRLEECTPEIRTYQSHNMIEPDADWLQHRLKSYDGLIFEVDVDDDADRERLVDALFVDPDDPPITWYVNNISRDYSYVLELGKHRIALVNTAFDAGLPADRPKSSEDVSDYLIAANEGTFGSGSHSEDASMIVAAAPNQVGFTRGPYDMLEKALANAPTDGVFIVGMHGPPINAADNEYPHYFRETEHPTADWLETAAFAFRHDELKCDAFSCLNEAAFRAAFKDQLPEWDAAIGEKHFAQGDFNRLLDYSVARCYWSADLDATSLADPALRLFLGEGVGRPVDLVLFGHVHRNVEYRVGLTADGKFRYFTDFYTDNPTRYYPSRKIRNFSDGEYDAPVHVYVERGPGGTAPSPAVRAITDHTLFAPWQSFRFVVVPRYPNPLNEVASDKARSWWEQHRPLLVQTASLGPIDINQRRDPWCLEGSADWQQERCEKEKRQRNPGPSFQGFRVIRIANDAIERMHYVTLEELRNNNFDLDWEPDGAINLEITPIPASPAANETCNGVTCAAGQLCCMHFGYFGDLVCIDPNTDHFNCGQCGEEMPTSGHRCGNWESCREGACVCVASAWNVQPAECPTGCTDLMNDRWNCGACGNGCPGASACQNGACACIPSEFNAQPADCANGCTDLSNDPWNCGACGVQCAGGTCHSGVCGCDPPRAVCNGQCTDLSNARWHCGACGNGCPGASACLDGTCVCVASEFNEVPAECANGCTDLNNDPWNCGACGTQCDSGSGLCAGGQCA